MEDPEPQITNTLQLVYKTSILAEGGDINRFKELAANVFQARGIDEIGLAHLVRGEDGDPSYNGCGDLRYDVKAAPSFDLESAMGYKSLGEVMAPLTMAGYKVSLFDKRK
tara:strand:+ start:1379 stop:1708 length:330 start_codon:yes stop_codon:yes gene_type:complete